jgi:hypothetical protein
VKEGTLTEDGDEDDEVGGEEGEEADKGSGVADEGLQPGQLAKS